MRLWGRSRMSTYFTTRQANRILAAQNCRFTFTVSSQRDIVSFITSYKIDFRHGSGLCIGCCATITSRTERSENLLTLKLICKAFGLNS